MNWSDEEYAECVTAWNAASDGDRMRAAMTRAVELAAVRGGTMTAPEVTALFEMPWVVNRVPMERVQTHFTAQGICIAALEQSNAHATRARVEVGAAVGAHDGEPIPDAVRRAMADAKARIAALEAERDDLRLRLAALEVAGAKLSAHVDKTTGEPERYPCSPTCTHDDAATPGHPERVKERIEAMKALSETILPGPDVVDGGPGTRGLYRRVSRGARDSANAYAEGAEAMRAACWEAAQIYLDSIGCVDGLPLRREIKAAIEGATP